MAHKVYEDEFVTEYADGTEEVRFSDREWEIMMSDPKFGYVCNNGHRLTDADRNYGGCFTCEYEGEAAYYEMIDEEVAAYRRGEVEFEALSPEAQDLAKYADEQDVDLANVCECNGGLPCDCPECDHVDCAYKQDPQPF